MKLLFTGSNGFLGRNIIQKLKDEYEIITLDIINADINCDISKSCVDLPQTDIVIHAAGKAHFVPKSQNENEMFYKVNLEGTKILCKSLEKSLPKGFVFVSTVAIYGVDIGVNITEENLLNGSTPYALSKIQAEKYLADWCKINNVKLGILRPSLIAGKNPPGNLGAMINGINTGKYFRIGNGSARKSILMAEDIARIIPKLADVGGTYNVCDNHHPSFAELEVLIAKQLNKKTPRAIPYWLAKSLALFGDIVGDKFPINSNKLNKIVSPLTFSNEKAKRDLDWEPLDVLENFKIH